jgi:hypothetical protein
MSRNSFRHGASQIGKGSGSKNKGKGVTWDKWTPPSLNRSQGKLPAPRPGEASDASEILAVPVVLIPGDYSDGAGGTRDSYDFKFHKYTTQFNNRKQYPELPCIRGDEHAPQNCIGCLKVERKEWQDSSDTKENVCINLAHLVNYHEVPWTKNGQIQTKKGSSDPVMIWKECTNSTIERQLWAQENSRTCDGCTNNAKTRIGGRRYLQLGFGNQKSIAEFEENVLSKTCKGCGTGVACIALKCASCSTMVANLESGSYTIDQIKALKEEKQVCSNAQCANANPQNPQYLDFVYRCGYNEDLLGYRADGLKCPDNAPATPYSIYDVALWLIRKGEGTDSRIHVHKWCPVGQFPWPGTGELVDLEGSGILKEAVPTAFDFGAMFNFDTTKQAKMLKCDDPFIQPGGYQNMAPQGQAPQQNQGYAQQPQATPQLPPPAAGQGYAPPAQQQPPQQQYAPPAPQQGYAPPAPQQQPPPAPPQQGYAPQAAPPGPPQQQAPQAPAVAAPYPQAPAAPGMPPAPPRPDYGNGN